MKSKQQLKRDVNHTNEMLKDDAIRLSLGTQAGYKRLEYARQSDDNVTFSHWARLEFREYCRRMLEKHPVIQSSLLAAEGARIIGISEITAKRYLRELKAGRTAPFMGFGDNIMLNHSYQPSEQDDYWQRDEEEDTE